jgi:hypothetical protein
MSDLQGSNSANAVVTAEVERSIHQHRVARLIPDAVKDAAPAMLKSLLDTDDKMPKWYLGASAIDRQHLKELINEHWRAKSVLDEVLGDLQHDIEAFARPLLVKAIEEQFKTLEDPESLTLQLYALDTLIFGLDTGASRLRRSTLLAAALHNFEEAETQNGHFRGGSGVFANDAQGAPTRVAAITAEQFASLSRQLDIGAQYQSHIKGLLLPQDQGARRTLQACSIASEKASLRMTALIARLKGDVSENAYDRLQEIVEGKREVALSGRPLLNHHLTVMGFKLKGVVLFSAVSKPSEIKSAVQTLTPPTLKFWTDWSRRVPGLSGNIYERFKLLQNFFANGPQGVIEEALRNEDIYNQTRLTGTLIAYIPGDPDHPLKEYASLAEFMTTLISQLREPDYQEFFSRFVDQKDKGKFAARANERLKTITWEQRKPLDMGPWWRETAIENPNAEPITNVIEGELWGALFRLRRDKAIADARKIAVPTGDEDAMTRWKRLTSILEIGWNVFNFGAMLVPGLGEAMLGIMVGQMLAELAEGIEDWSEGDKQEASAHLTGVLLNFAQLALMGAGHLLPAQVPPVKTSPFVEQLKPVQINGQERLWNPDLSVYEHPAVLAEKAQADDLGLFQHEGQRLLPMEDKHYAVIQDPETGEHRLQHPTRPEAYQPVVEHNGAGSWKTEVDEPLSWGKARLLRRLGASVEQWPDETLEQIRTVAGVSEDVLRRTHVELEPPPLMLSDTLKRFSLYAEAGEVGQQILANQVPERLLDQIARLMTDLPRWPETRALEVFDDPELKGTSTIIGNMDVANEKRIKLTRADVRAGQLPQRIIETLDEGEIHELLGQSISSQKEVRIQALKETLANQATRKQKDLFETLYKQHEVADGAQLQRLTDAYSDLPSAVAAQLLAEASTTDLEHLAQKQTLPLRLREQLRQAQHQVRVSRAYEGLYLEGLENNDTRRLELASLATLPGWSSDVRIEIREYSHTGKLHASVGAEDAPIRKVLVLEEDGRYQARDDQDQHLHGSDDFFASLLHALPDDERMALGYDIFEGERLRVDVRRSPLDMQQFESMLNEHPLRKPAYDPDTMRLRGGMQGYRQLVDQPMLERRLGSLYPNLPVEEMRSMLTEFGDAAATRIKALEDEFSELNKTMRRWMNSPTMHHRFGPLGVAEWNARDRLYTLIRQCWQRTGPAGIEVPGIIGAQRLQLDGIPMGRHLATFPGLAANFDHVTSLSMRDASFLSGQGSFLEKFPSLRSLDLSDNLMNRLPPVVGDLRYLTHLGLENNQITLTEQAVARIRALKRLEVLMLANNPLGIVPDISQMPRLAVLNLESCSIDQWPVGLFGQSRPRHIYLNLKYNFLTQIPEVAPGSFRAELLARTIVSREPEWMPPRILEKLKFYAESLGMDPDRSYPPRGLQDNLQWAQGMPESVFRERLILWDEIEDQIGSEQFFNVIRRLTESADFKTPETSYRTELTAKLWRLLDAMYDDTELRETAFSESVVVTECSDGATQLFNALGVRVLVKEAYQLGHPDLIEAELVELARGKSRLDEIGALVRRRIAQRLESGERIRRVNAAGDVTGSIDEVEVQLAYMTDLAESLDLPWQSRGLLFRAISGVTPEMIQAARLHVLALEQGDLLAEGILLQPLWDQYLEKTYAAEISKIKLEMQNEDEVVPFLAIKELKKTVTNRAIERAKLLRTEIPFTVHSDR